MKPSLEGWPTKAKEAPSLFTFKRHLIFAFSGYDILFFGYEIMLIAV